MFIRDSCKSNNLNLYALRHGSRRQSQVGAALTPACRRSNNNNDNNNNDDNNKNNNTTTNNNHK